MNETLGLMVGSNDVHIRFFESVSSKIAKVSKHIDKRQNTILKGIDLVKTSLEVPSDYKTVLTESCYYYPAFKKKAGMLKSKIINMNTSPVFYNLEKEMFNKLMNSSLKDLLRYVNGHLIMGRYGIELLERIDEKKPYEIIYPFISDQRYEKLKTIKQQNPKRIVTMTTKDYNCKGTDLVIKAFEEIVKERNDFELHIYGNADLTKEISKVDQKIRNRIMLAGYEKDVEKIFNNAAVFVSPGRGDIFPVATLEALCAGIPSIVSEETGTKEVVEKINKKYVTRLDENEIATAILDAVEQKNLSEKCKKQIGYFREGNMIRLFKQSFEKLKNRT